ncbi:hypothetical protein L1049_002154 [Liquidambar formosana]|uniref:Ribosomal protein L34Ae n=1 Tax=Liquidambar formosana TaxID=63359 RepID=A0AAP0NH79_LIQFO
MGTPRVFVFNTHFGLVNMGSVNQFLHRKMVLLVASFWVFVCSYLLPLFGFITKSLFRLHGHNGSRKENSNCSAVIPQDNNKADSNCIEPEQVAKPEAEPRVVELIDSDDDGPKFFFKFQFPSYEELRKSNGGNKDSNCSEVIPSTSTSKYEFICGKDFSGFMEEPEVKNFAVEELFVNSKGKNKIVDDGFLSEKDFVQPNSEAEAVLEEKPENTIDSICREETADKVEPISLAEDNLSEKGQPVNAEKNLVGDQDVSDEVSQFLSEKDFWGLDSDSESIVSSHEFSVMCQLIDSNSDGFLSDKDFGIEGNDADEEDRDIMEELQKLEESHIKNSSAEHDESNGFDEEDRDIMEELQKLEETQLQNSGILDSELLSQRDFHGEKAETKQEEFNDKDNRPTDGLHNSGKPDSQNSSAMDSEDSHGLETLWEHQDLIEQLKMELKKVRATGLPTILEESESPKISEDLKPWKIDEKFQHEDPMGELHKLYKSYRERMRKFDILNYQKMYAIGFLQSKDPLQSVSSHKTSAQAITSLFSHNFRLGKRKKAESDPTMKFIRELHSDLEMVYVGQMCLSWEFLQWQYEKALELWESDPRGIRRYNEVAGEFQQFQVLMQRFIENEPFQGPRVQNYVKNRCVLRNLLQVPVIREDSLKDKKKRIGRTDDAITSDMLVEIMEESIRIFWRFVRADKHETNVILKYQKGTQVELQDPADSELLSEVRTNLQKKEKKLRDILRTGNCILRRFQKHQEDSSDHVLYFFSQVDMKLVSRVLNMSRITTDQLVWCHSKLSKISFVNRKIHVEPSFLLFPC